MFYFRTLFLAVFFFFAWTSLAIYNPKTNTEEKPKVNEKHWVLVAQGCHSCSELLTELTRFCSNQKPFTSKIGFFATGPSPSALLKKLKSFKNYDIFFGTPKEFYQAYRLQGSPSLLEKGNTKKILVGKDKILSFLKKDKAFCSTQSTIKPT